MPVKKRVAKVRSHRITETAVEAFTAALRGRARYAACTAGQGCDSDEPSRHCETCAAAVEASRRLNRELGLRPWEASPLDAHDGPGPTDGTAYAASWEMAVELRRELLAAAGMQPRASSAPALEPEHAALGR